MRDPFEQLRRIQEAILKVAEYTKKGRRRFDREESGIPDLELKIKAILDLER